MIAAARNWLTRSIARKLAVAFFSVFLLTYLATAIVVLSAVRAAVTDAELGALAQLARFKLGELDAQMAQMAVNLGAWSRLDVMNDLASGDVDRRVAGALESLRSGYRLQGQLYAFDGAGRLVAGSGGPVRPVALPALWRSGGALRFIDKHADPMGGGDVIALSMPVRSAYLPGYGLGTLVLTYPWSAVRAQLAADHALLLRDGNPPTLLQGDVGAVPGALALRELATRIGWLDVGGRAELVNHASLSSGLLSGWKVVVADASGRITAHLRGVALELAGLCVLLALPLTLAIRWLAMRLSAPLRELTRVVTGVTETRDLAEPVALRTNDELGSLASAFNAMAERLQGAARERERFVLELKRFAEELENKVEARTRELRDKNDELSLALQNLRAAQAQLVQQEKMASLGQLVAGVAHEINNPIGFIYANSPYLEEYFTTLVELLEAVRALPMPESSAAELHARYAAADLEFLREDLAKILRSSRSGAARVKGIVSSLRSFSRLDEAVLKPARIEDGLDDTLALLQHDLKARIRVERDYQLNREVLCLPGQLNQVFMNLLHNAIHAIDGPGVIRVATAAEGEWAVVRIADSGCGIAPENLGRIFDPFFTTKKVGEGTGLGLSISYGIIEKHGGRIEVDSEPGRGTTFTIRLPIDGPDA